MDLQTIFYVLGSIFFLVSLILLTILTVGLIFFYIQLRKKIRSVKKGVEYFKNAQEFAGRFPAIFAPIILFVLNSLINKIKSRFSD